MSNRIDSFTDAVLSATDRLRPDARHVNAAAERQYIAAEQSGLSAEDRATYQELMEHDRWLGTVCGTCGDPLSDDGACARCESEAADERRNDL